MSEFKPFIPGFETVQEALDAGREFYAKANGARGRYQRDFHITENKHGRFHFVPGPRPAGETSVPFYLQPVEG